MVLSDFEHHSQAGNLELLRRINSYIVEDVQQYVKKSERERVLRVLVQLQFQIAGKNKKLQISKVAHDARLKGFSSIIKCLCDAGIVIPCRALDHPALPLEENYAEKRFKLYMADLVLLIAMFDNNDLTYFGSKEFTRELTRGMIENQVGAELSKAGAELFYYKRPNSPLQIPFFLQSSKYLVPIEISGQGRSKALRTLIEDKRYPDFWGIKLGRENIGFKDSLLTLPLSTAFLLPRLLALGGPI